MDGFNLPPGGMGPLDPTDIRTDDEIDTDPDCALCQEAATTLHAYQEPDEDDGLDPEQMRVGACQHELPSGYLCGDEQRAPQHAIVVVQPKPGSGRVEPSRYTKPDGTVTSVLEDKYHWVVGQDGGIYPPPTEYCTHGADGSWSGDCPVCVTGGES